MDLNKRIFYVDKVINYLKEKHVGTVPEAILGYNQYPENNSEMDKILKEVEFELIFKQVATKQGRTLNGYHNLNLTDKAYGIKSADDLYVSEKIQSVVMENLKLYSSSKPSVTKILKKEKKQIKLNWELILSVIGVTIAAIALYYQITAR